MRISRPTRPEQQSPSAQLRTTVQAAFAAALNICNPDTLFADRAKAEAQRWSYLRFHDGDQSAAQKLIENATNLGLEIPEIVTKAIAAFSNPPEFQNYR
jgi:hypothetical protein